MSAGARVRRARPDDASGIARVLVEAWRDTYVGIVPDSYLVRLGEKESEFRWRSRIVRCRPPHTMLVAEIGDPDQAIVGFGDCGPAGSGTFAGEIYRLYVASDWRGRGIGRRLLRALFRNLVGNGMKSGFLWVLSANPSRFFYEAMGSERVAERKEEFAGVLLDETAYGWPDLAGWLAARRP